VDGIKLHTYPNPAVDVINVDYQTEQNSSVTIEIISMNGQRVMTLNEGMKSTGKHSAKMDVATLPAGNYFVAIQAGNSRVAKRISINR
jgi:flagellar hook assembly protein FlgD